MHWSYNWVRITWGTTQALIWHTRLRWTWGYYEYSCIPWLSSGWTGWNNALGRGPTTPRWWKVKDDQQAQKECGGHGEGQDSASRLSLIDWRPYSSLMVFIYHHGERTSGYLGLGIACRFSYSFRSVDRNWEEGRTLSSCSSINMEARSILGKSAGMPFSQHMAIPHMAISWFFPLQQAGWVGQGLGYIDWQAGELMPGSMGLMLSTYSWSQ